MEITGNMQMSGPIHRIWKITSIPSDRFENKIINCLIFVKVYIKSLLNLFERKKVLVSDKLMIIKNKQTWCLGLPTIDGNTALGASSPAKPALHIPDPLSITKAATSSSHIFVLWIRFNSRKDFASAASWFQVATDTNARVYIYNAHALKNITLYGSYIAVFLEERRQFLYKENTWYHT